MLPENVSEIKQLRDNASGERIAPIHAQNKAVELILKIVGTLHVLYCTGCCAVFPKNALKKWPKNLFCTNQTHGCTEFLNVL